MAANRSQRICVLLFLVAALSAVTAVKINKKHKHTVIAQGKQIHFEDAPIDEPEIDAPTFSIEKPSQSKEEEQAEIEAAQDAALQKQLDEANIDDGGLSELKTIDISVSEGQTKLIRSKLEIHNKDPNSYEEVEYCEVLSELDCAAVMVDGVERYFRRLPVKDLSKIPFNLISRCEPSLCKNNGLCVQELDDVVSCNCRPGTGGQRCEQFLENPCAAKPCENEGICTRLLGSDLGYLCACPTGFGCHRCQCKVGPDGVPHKIRPQFDGGVADPSVSKDKPANSTALF